MSKERATSGVQGFQDKGKVKFFIFLLWNDLCVFYGFLVNTCYFSSSMLVNVATKHNVLFEIL
jgi:hypothetical protein